MHTKIMNGRMKVNSHIHIHVESNIRSRMYRPNEKKPRRFEPSPKCIEKCYSSHGQLGGIELCVCSEIHCIKETAATNHWNTWCTYNKFCTDFFRAVALSLPFSLDFFVFRRNAYNKWFAPHRKTRSVQKNAESNEWARKKNNIKFKNE